MVQRSYKSYSHITLGGIGLSWRDDAHNGLATLKKIVGELSATQRRAVRDISFDGTTITVRGYEWAMFMASYIHKTVMEVAEPLGLLCKITR